MSNWTNTLNIPTLLFVLKFSHTGRPAWKWLSVNDAYTGNSAHARPDYNSSLSRDRRRSREGNFDHFGVNSRRHVCEIIDGKLDLVTFSSLLLTLFRLYRPAHGAIVFKSGNRKVSVVYLVTIDVG
ncbi:hypothetical protein ARMSODRAFT_1027238 [Armillaria solidipes]|uniref:Uncharacterized protein n=1 Tax=Armillaria solidipes TaxID=1076256 RepID=A0A2H3AL64_9AGAR|nr:hypothetical protein ARMSODRAFT_1027238 [Armillaria solidipes]